MTISDYFEQSMNDLQKPSVNTATNV